MSRFFSLNGMTVTELIRNLAPDESIVLDLISDEGYDKPMRANAATATGLGYKIEQTTIKAIETKQGIDVVTRLIRVRRTS